VSTLLLGFSRVEQIDENMGSLEVYKKWNRELEEKIEAALGNTPAADLDFKERVPFPSRRSVAVLEKHRE
jgi:hypothetical protein